MFVDYCKLLTCGIPAAGDNALSYLEFRSFLRVLRHEDLGEEGSSGCAEECRCQRHRIWLKSFFIRPSIGIIWYNLIVSSFANICYPLISHFSSDMIYQIESNWYNPSKSPPNIPRTPLKSWPFFSACWPHQITSSLPLVAGKSTAHLIFALFDLGQAMILTPNGQLEILRVAKNIKNRAEMFPRFAMTLFWPTMLDTVGELLESCVANVSTMISTSNTFRMVTSASPSRNLSKSTLWKVATQDHHPQSTHKWLVIFRC